MQEQVIENTAALQLDLNGVGKASYWKDIKSDQYFMYGQMGVGVVLRPHRISRTGPERVDTYSMIAWSCSMEKAKRLARNTSIKPATNKLMNMYRIYKQPARNKSVLLACKKHSSGVPPRMRDE